ncbi:S-DNA-T family DNA segregation ATPase FtsK/SpoIIIE [Microbacterium natoriense]|uniref:S-DNA-T family DNA segregation ATPase FtsK/SpoIIIE n=2 Tax=Microbacterium natoriense TaxID=284570 RepID=A0AAW8EY31_9MICO|nr:S-DNA-T family DNA segregation ATPase FtsK/SpoIIIE [Microbacterium natoriense]
MVCTVGMDSLTIAIPAAPAEAKRPPMPFMAALVPVAGGVVMWLVTGSLFALCFAALGPLMIAASLIDGARARRRARRIAEIENQAAWERAEDELVRRHDEERALQDLRCPDAACAMRRPPLRGPEGADAATLLVVGRGGARSEIRSSGGDDDRARAFQKRCGRLDDSPIAVPLGGGVCLRGPEPLVLAVMRGLVVQLCLRFSAAQVAIVGERMHEWGIGGFGASSRREALRVGVARIGEPRPQAESVIWIGAATDEVPEGVTTVLDVVEPRRASLRTPHGIAEVSAEGVSVAQTAAISATRAEGQDDIDVLPTAVALSDLAQHAGSSGLPATIGRNERDEVVVDIVEDGPHAIVTGTTGTGKSELLVSWVAAMASAHGPERVLFVLADFKGGTAFEPLRELPQVVAVITDLDEAGARRGVSSLTAELRRRESVLASAGVRDVRDSDMPRLVIVVDEFAALLQEHADLGAVFTDIAARGRALGMHLVIGTQRASGVIRDALAANCPLRVSLRVGDPSDSRLVIGTDAAAELPGGAASRGLALIRRPQDAEPIAMRVALTRAADLRAAAVTWADAEAAQSPWLPALRPLVRLAELPAPPPGNLVLGQADEPERQRQPVQTLRVGVERGLAVLGGSGSGRTSLLRLIRHQHPSALWLPADVEAAWDVVADLSDRRTTAPDLILCDDLDALLADLPPEHAQVFAQRWEQVLRAGAETTFVLTATRASGAVGRLMDALPRRALLRMPSRVEHLAAGGESATFDRDRAPGRATLGERDVQIAWVDEEGFPSSPVSHPMRWTPSAQFTAVVTSGPHAVARAMQEAHPGCEVVLAPLEPSDSARPAILVADSDTWQRNWQIWQRIRAHGEVLIRAENPADLRQLAGVRETPPFAHLHAGRAWSLRDAAQPQRVVLPELMSR